MTVEDKKEIFARLEQEIETIHNVKTNISYPQPMDGVECAYVLNVGRCIGCRKCVYACMKNNNTSCNLQIRHIRVLKISQGSVDLETSSHDYPIEEGGKKDVYATQLTYGLGTTGMGDEVSWGFYISNFSFLVGMATAAVMMIIPADIFKDKEVHKVVSVSELFTIAAIVMALFL